MCSVIIHPLVLIQIEHDLALEDVRSSGRTVLRCLLGKEQGSGFEIFDSFEAILPLHEEGMEFLRTRSAQYKCTHPDISFAGIFCSNDDYLDDLQLLSSQTENRELLVVSFDETRDLLRLQARIYTGKPLLGPAQLRIIYESSANETIALNSLFDATISAMHPKSLTAVDGMAEALRRAIQKAMDGIHAGSPDVYLLAMLNHVLACLKQGVTESDSGFELDLYRAERHIAELASTDQKSALL